mmetsp:Transcript_33860/g.97367  ORF Transcript_33860/g.97367 Transcript_33860/m.97367 type:complete len:403 (+) Transcript_33860:70-1278(+)
MAPGQPSSSDIEASSAMPTPREAIVTTIIGGEDAPRSRWAHAGVVFLWGVMYIMVSAALIAYNKYLITPGRFPYSVPLVFIHALFSSTLASALLLCCPSLFPSLTDPVKRINVDRSVVLGGALPIAILFSGQLVLSNTAYLHSSVAFIQMMKEANLALVYTLSLVAALERFNWRNAWILVCIIMATSLTIHGELNFSWTGFSLQGTSQLFESSKIVLQAMLLSSHGKKLDAMTYVLLVMPLCAVVLGVALLVLIFVWPNEHLAMPAGHELAAWAPHLFLNACVAFTLNVVIALFMKMSSAVAFILAGICKDAMIVTSGVFLFREVISGMQAIGFSLQLLLILVYTLGKTFPDKFEQGVIPGLVAVLFDIKMSSAPVPLKPAKDYGALDERRERSAESAALKQ